MAFLLVPVLEGLAELVAVSSVELGASEAVGVAIGSQAASSLASVVNEKVSELAVDLIGEEATEEVKQQSVLGSDFAYSLFFGSRQEFAESVATKKNEKRNTQHTQQNDQRQQEEQESKDMIDKLTVLKEEQITNVPKAPPIQESLGKPLARYINDLAKEVSVKEDYSIINGTLEQNNSSMNLVMTGLSKLNPVYSYFTSKILEYGTGAVVPTNDVYKQVSSIYNGTGLYEQDVIEEIIDGQRHFSIIDETGTKVFWNTAWNTYRVVPPIWGIWCGINSPNDNLPISGTVNYANGRSVLRQSYLDKICMLHDISYNSNAGGHVFSLVGDYALISRAIYGKENNLFVFPGELETANIAINYFCTLGSISRGLLGDNTNSLKSSIEIKEIENDTNDTTGETDTENNFIDFIVDDPSVYAGNESKEFIKDTVFNEFKEQVAVLDFTIPKNVSLINKLKSIKIELL